ncbi:hypothetical protein [Synechococcus sp. A15-28]|uniref:hypothetical protein n=1 Tax=Synechococcus sp. A15-28 TaxID=1050638 RepID=UPI0016494ABF|nr:hypothetical protein [Synechococcus sp. A15-28]QNI41148.1 nucleotide-diphospho-sugar transferase [Synechococcus sp. A15-28]
MLHSRSIIYVATGESYVKEAIKNAKLTREYSIDIPIYIVTDLPGNQELYEVFDYVLPHQYPTYSYRDKILPLVNLPTDECLFLDSDAFLIYSAHFIFEVCQHYEVAATHAPVRHPPGWDDCVTPLLFPEYNSGVLFLRRSTIISSFIKYWLDLYDKVRLSHNQSWDQATLRSSLWQFISNHNLKLLTLPPEVNLRTTKPWTAGRGLPVFVIHGRLDVSELDSFIHYLNSDIDCFRTWSHWINIHPSSSIQPRHDRTFH